MIEKARTFYETMYFIKMKTFFQVIETFFNIATAVARMYWLCEVQKLYLVLNFIE